MIAPIRRKSSARSRGPPGEPQPADKFEALTRKIQALW